jgi:hypothetical protein
VIRGLTITPGLRDRIQGCLIPEDSTLVLDGDICLENVNVDAVAALVVDAAPSAYVTIKEAAFSTKPTFEIQELTDAEITSPNVPEYLRIRGSGSSSRRGNSIPLRLEATGCWRPLLSAFIFETSQQAHLLPCRMSPQITFQFARPSGSCPQFEFGQGPLARACLETNSPLWTGNHAPLSSSGQQ